ncbi:MAG: FTR1 family protein [Candidatus Woesearchaeota archaeon]|jgi:high-affinity iron transporter|nr:FTR1 family protein [Candidatus Woesearchaeota archaeon]
MISSFVITFRETLEAALIIGIILAYLVKTKRTKYNNIVYLGITSAIIASIIAAFLFNSLAGGFTGRAEEIFEGIAMLFAAFLITFMILWMLKQKHVQVELHQKVQKEIDEQHKAGLFFLVFISVFREGIETVIFLSAANFATSATNGLMGALIGIIAAVILGYAIFVWGKNLNLKKFFNVTGVILILFAAGLVVHGVHEFQEAKLLPTYIEHVWDMNPPENPDGSFPALHEKGSVGSIAKGLLGYNGNPSLIEVFSYLAYILAIVLLWRNIDKVHEVI